MSKLDLAIKNGNAAEALRLGGEEARAAANRSDDVRQVSAIPEHCLPHALSSAIRNGSTGRFIFRQDSRAWARAGNANQSRHSAAAIETVRTAGQGR